MKKTNQQIKMARIAELLNGNLSYIHGERENGVNGEKKEFMDKSAAFLRTLGKDLGFTEMKVTKNPGGIAVSGDVTLMGMWNDGNGLYFNLSQSYLHGNPQLYRVITNMRDFHGDRNRWLPMSVMLEQDYEGMLDILLTLKASEVYHDLAA
ncbi:hypothetical protein FACS1894208_01670 [Clostridia bacterium]|nr:hypothetical protein FACS1894208_01670 [Clostridia bacterium]